MSTEPQQSLHEKLREARAEVRRFKKRSRRNRAELRSVARDYLLLKMPKGGACAEIGVNEGEFSEQILRQNQPEKLHLVDPWQYMEEFPAPCCCRTSSQAEMDAKYEKVRHRLEDEIRSGQVILHRVTSEAAAEQFPDNYFDWLYVDGNHLYEFVRADLQNLWPKIKPGGYITGDDYGIKGWWGGGVTRAVDEFVHPRNLELEVKFTQFMVHKPH